MIRNVDNLINSHRFKFSFYHIPNKYQTFTLTRVEIHFQSHHSSVTRKKKSHLSSVGVQRIGIWNKINGTIVNFLD